MIDLSFLNLHPSSPVKILGNMDTLAKRNDLYTGEDFYFGFDSSNQSFLEMVGGKHPLAIKHGPTLSIYHQSIDGYHYEMHLIDYQAKALVPVIDIKAKPTEAAVFRSLLPFHLTDFYRNFYDKTGRRTEVDKVSVDNLARFISSSLESIVKTGKLSQENVERLPKVASGLDACTVSLGNIKLLAAKSAQPRPTSEDFVTAYDPFVSNARIEISELLKMNPSRVTVREINGNYPRMEIIIPGLAEDKSCVFVFKSNEKDLYLQLQSALPEARIMQDLLNQHFPEQMTEYFANEGFSAGSVTSLSK